MGLLPHEQLERVTLVAEQRGRVAAAAHLLRYGDGAEVGGVLPRCWGDSVAAALPDAPFWADASAADDAVAVAAVTFLARSGASRLYADGALLAPGVYGLPRSGPMCTPFSTGPDSTPGDRTEIVFLADSDVLVGMVTGWPGRVVVGHRHGDGRIWA